MAGANKSDPRLLQVDMARALNTVQQVLDFGAKKYKDLPKWNEDSIPVEQLHSAALRHGNLTSRRGLDVVDAESGLRHIAHQIANLLMILQRSLDKEAENSPTVDLDVILERTGWA